MAMITYPLDNIDYSAADAGLFHCTRKSGVWAEDSFPISASGSDNSITIGGGVAWISNDKYWGKVVAQKEAVTLDLGLADPVYNRIDAVVIQFDSNANVTDIVVKKGTPATNPSMPEIVQSESIFELCLCKVLRPAGSSVVTFTNIADTRLDPTICGLMADSVTKIDTKAINAQVQALILSLTEEIESVKNKSGLMYISDWVEDGAIPIAKGGTDATTAEEALANLGVVNYIVDEYDMTDEGGIYHIIKYNSGLCKITGKRKLAKSTESVAIGGFHRAVASCLPPIELTDILYVDGSFHESGIFLTCKVQGVNSFEVIFMRPTAFTFDGDEEFRYDLLGEWR